MTRISTRRGGAGFRRRLGVSPFVSLPRAARAVRALTAALAVGLLAAGCDNVGNPAPTSAPEPPSSSPSATEPDPRLVDACQTFWGDPTYDARLARDVLDRIATAADDGAGDPYFYSLTADDIAGTFERAPEDARAAADDLAAWFTDQAPQGADADSARPALDAVASACADVSAAAQWFLQPDGEPGTKPAALVCADVFDTPNTYLPFANANVLTSNMFRLVGLTGHPIPADGMDEVEWTAQHLASEAELVDDPGVADALGSVRAPFDAAVGGNMNPGGLQGPIEELAAACTTAGYEATITPPEDPGEETL